MNGNKLFALVGTAILALCFVGLPLMLFILWYFELGRAADWKPEMCLMPWVPGICFAWFFGCLQNAADEE